MPADIAESLEDARAELDQEQVDYERTLELKLGLARRIYDRSGSAEIKARPLETPSVASDAGACSRLQAEQQPASDPSPEQGSFIGKSGQLMLVSACRVRSSSSSTK